MAPDTPPNTILPQQFHKASKQQKTQPGEAARPFSIRFTDTERARLKAKAGRTPLGTYARAKLLGDGEEKRRRSVRPSPDQKTLALLLGELGRSRLASNMNQIAKAANIGVLDVGPDLISELEGACRDIAEMRRELIAALGVKPETGEPSFAKASED